MSRAHRRTFLKGAGALAVSALAAKAARTAPGRDGKPDSGGNTSPNKPKPISTGPSQAEGIAAFACRARYEDLTPERRERLEVSVLDSLACAINALGAQPIEACLAQAKEFGGPGGRCTLIGGGQANVVYAASYNTALVFSGCSDRTCSRLPRLGLGRPFVRGESDCMRDAAVPTAFEKNTHPIIQEIRHVPDRGRRFG
jgi:MmgE/PrpD N-terminal domain